MGSSLYQVAVKITPVPKARWTAICTDCAGAIDSLVELLQGRLSEAVMQRICARETGLFPAPAEITLSCSCPDWAEMCKHVAAVLYGIGARLDARPELLFLLRKVDEKDLIAQAGTGLPLSRTAPASDKLLAMDGLAELFGLDLAPPPEEPAPEAARARKMPAQKSAPPNPSAKSGSKPLAPKGRGVGVRGRKRSSRASG